MSGWTLGETLFAGSTVRLFGRRFHGLRLATEDLTADRAAEAAQAEADEAADKAAQNPGDQQLAQAAQRSAKAAEAAWATVEWPPAPPLDPKVQRTPVGAPPVLRALEEKLEARNGDTGTEPGLARIYGFSFQGNYFKLAMPTVLLVYGNGLSVPPTFNRAALSIIGVEFKDETFASEVRMWAQDQADYSVRIDITSGWLWDVLIEPEMSDANNVTGGVAPDAGGQGVPFGRAAAVGRAAAISRPGKG
jgi:hypothetical protein